MSLTDELLAAGFSAMVGKKVFTNEQYRRERNNPNSPYTFKPLDLDYVMENSYKVTQGPGIEEDNPVFDENDPICPLCNGVVLVYALDGTTYTVHICLHKNVEDLKQIIERKSGIPSDEQRLTLAGKQLDDSRTLESYNIKPRTTIHLIRRLRGGAREEALYLDASLRDSRLDCDFTDQDDGSTKFYRGSRQYYRPCGWQRYALNVSGKFLDGDEWLGAPGIRTKSSRREWPVSYHGTDMSNASSIAGGGYDLSKGERFAFGIGIYSSPHIDVAACYAQEFPYNGKSYQMVFQNRVRNNFEVIPSSTTGRGEYWVSSSDEDIRPYGICIKETLYQVTTPRQVTSSDDGCCIIL